MQMLPFEIRGCQQISMDISGKGGVLSWVRYEEGPAEGREARIEPRTSPYIGWIIWREDLGSYQGECKNICPFWIIGLYRTEIEKKSERTAGHFQCKSHSHLSECVPYLRNTSFVFWAEVLSVSTLHLFITQMLFLFCC